MGAERAVSVPRGVYPNIPERIWQGHVVRIARILGYSMIYHTFMSARSDPGFPDLLCIRPAAEGRRGRVVFIECKVGGRQPTSSQRAWLDALSAAGAEAHVFWPGDEERVAETLA